jgi:exodeoxyribonuclease V alpha subunit
VSEPKEDRYSPALVLELAPDDLLRHFNRAGVLVPADVHAARVMERLGGCSDPLVALAAALAARGPRAGHVLVDLATVASTVVAEGAAGATDGTEVGSLPWPSPAAWAEALEGSPLVNVGEGEEPPRPLRLVGGNLYLERYWRDEGRVAADFLARADAPVVDLDGAWLQQVLADLFPGGEDGLQARAAETCARRLLSIVVGGPGTGKTTTVARALALLYLVADRQGAPWPLVALAAPTGKAAARMAEAVHEEARHLAVPERVRAQLLGLDASTVHRLLGRHPAGLNRFRHDRTNQLPHDVVVVDETSMMSLPLMARLVEAVRPDARLVLLGDPEQLASVEAGAVLADVVGALPPVAEPPPALGSSVTVLQVNHRFGGPLAEVAAAVREGDAPRAVELLASGGHGTLSWVEADLDEVAADSAELGGLRASATTAAGVLAAAASAGDIAGALDALGRARLLCAHRDGPSGASTWNLQVEMWLAEAGADVHGDGAWYAGRPVVITENDYGLGLFNGDTGVAVRRPDGGLHVVFQRGLAVQAVSPARIGAVATAFAITAHRAQGSEFEDVAVLLPGPTSRILTRELLYTALTRARQRVLVVSSREALEVAIARPVARASGLARRLRR